MGIITACVGRQPGRESAGEMFDQDADKALEAAERRAVDQDRALALVVAVDIFQVEALRQIIIHLYGAQLPFALQHIAHDKIQLGSIKGGFALFDMVYPVPILHRR